MGVAAPLVLEQFSALSKGTPTAGPALLSRLIHNKEQTEEELKYAINRLIKGAASNRQVAREGYFSALTVLLSTKTDISITNVIEVLNKELPITGNCKGEVGELSTGHVLVCGAVMRSNLFIRGTDEERILLMTMLFAATAKRSYLNLATYSFIVDFIQKHSEEEMSLYLWPHIKKYFETPLQEYSLDTLYCLIVLCEQCPGVSKKFLKKKLEIKSLICEETLACISDKIMNIPEFSYVNHPIYESFARLLVKSDYAVEFWSNGIETKLDYGKENRVLVILTILGEMLRNIGDKTHLIPLLLGNKFMPVILEWFKGFQSACQTGKPITFRGKSKAVIHESKGREITDKAREAFDIIVASLKEDKTNKGVKLDVLKKLLFSPGDIMFCDITNTRIIKLLIEELDLESVQCFAKILKKVLSNESKKTHPDSAERYWTNSERLRAAEMLTYLINHRTTSEEVKWRTKYMQFFIQISLFKSTGCDEMHVSSELSVAVKKCFFRCLTQRLPKLEILLKILNSLVSYIEQKLWDQQQIERNIKSFSPQVLESWKSMIEFKKMLEESNQASKAVTVFQILALHCGLFLFSDVMTADTAQNSLKEVRSCYEHFVQDNKKTKGKKTHKEGDVVDDEPEWTEVLVDIFLSFLSRDSYLLRNVVQCVFRLLCDYVTPSAIGQILTVLDPEEDSNLMSYKEQHEDEESDSEDETSEKSDQDESEQEEDDEELEEDPEDEEVTVNDQFRMAVQKALGNAAPDTDTESIDIDNLDDEEGKRIDDALSSAFKMLKQSKGDLTKRDKRNNKVLMEFRVRVLDLLNIYLEKVPSMEICLGMILPLFKCLEFAIKDTAQKPLEDKVRKCLKFLTGIRTFASTDGVTMDLLTDYLKSITEKGSRTQFVFQALGDVISKCGVFIVRCSQKISNKTQKGHDTQIITIYNEYLEAFFNKRDCLLPVILFHDILQLKWQGNWDLLATVIQHTFSDNVRPFRKHEGLEMINMFYQYLKRNIKANPGEDKPKELKNIEKLFSNNILSYLEKCESNLNERFFCILCKTLISIKNYHTCFNQENDNMNWNSVTAIIQKTRKLIKLKNGQEYSKFCNLLKIVKIKNSEVNKIDEKDLVDSGHDSNTDETSDTEAKNIKPPRIAVNGDGVSHKAGPKREKRKSKDISKKESKKLRMIASSEGFQVISFSTLVQNSNMDVNDIVEEPEVTDVKKSKRKLKDEEHQRRKDKKKAKTV